MDARNLLETLGYTQSPSFVTCARIDEDVEHAHVLRRAVSACKLDGGLFHGAYQLREPGESAAATSVVYVAEAPSVAAADAIHRRVWNQAAVPFLLVRLPDCVRLYSGFRYGQGAGATHRGPADGVLAAAVKFNHVLTELGDFHASRVDDGTLWRERADDVDPRSRVDWRLLENLRALGAWLHKSGLGAPVAHALIGKFVFLRYLRDREILSERRLAEMGIEPTIFARPMTLRDFRKLVDAVDDWLNGEIFPISFSGVGAPTGAHVRELAGVFLGNDATTGQTHLDFAAYDFSYIPIETLSVIYEQFLATESRDREAGAFYTPISVVNFILAEIDDLRPLRPNNRVLDPACGSGAFLVQCYRRMIEQHRRALKRDLRPTELREILVRQVFGVDRDPDACRVAELSLLLTMLDYIDPPDLRSTSTHRFRLPTLHGTNVFEGDFFADGPWRAIVQHGFDWIVGNPPWVQLASGPTGADTPAATWMRAHAKDQPVAGRQVAEAFAWKALPLARPDGAIGLLLPAMSLFCEQKTFRTAFFSRVDVQRVLNLTNLRRVLFAGRAEAPAVALFYTSRTPSNDQDILAFSPLIANQEANRPPGPGTRRMIWTITLNRSEIRSLRRDEVTGGSPRPWKIAMWGSDGDRRVLDLVERKNRRLGDLEESGRIWMSAGLELRRRDDKEPVERLSEVAGRMTLKTAALKETDRIHVFPSGALEPVPPDLAYVRAGRGKLPLSVCRPPHVVVHGGGNYAIFSDEFLRIPPRQVGIGAAAQEVGLLQALALFLSSDFATYHQFFDSPAEGVRDGRSTLASLRRIPMPLFDMGRKELATWVGLHRRIVEQANATESAVLRSPTHEAEAHDLECELNKMVSDALGLGERQRWLVEDLVHVRRGLSDSRVGSNAVRAPLVRELDEYLETLRAELDGFLDPALGKSHRVTLVTEGSSGMVEVRVVARPSGSASRVAADQSAGAALREIRGRLEKAHPQWLYFDRNLFLFDEEAWFILKPMQRFCWTRSQALEDANQLIAETLSADAS